MPLGVATLVATLSGCGGIQVTNATSGPLRAPVLTGAGTAAPPGAVVIFSLSAENATGSSVRLASVNLLPVPGDHLPRLVHTAVLVGGDQLEDGRGWPPTTPGGPGVDGSWPMAAIAGFVVPAHSDVTLAVAVSGQRVGETVLMGGLVVQYSFRGTSYRSDLGMVNMVCVDSAARYESDGCNSRADQRFENRADGYVTHLTLGQ